MTYSVYQHWDPLKVCIVGRSYSPEFYSFITNSRVRQVMERIAYETEEDYQKLIKLLESFGVEVLRPTVASDYQDVFDPSVGKIIRPPMTPRDYSIMLGNNFSITASSVTKRYNQIKGADWPTIETINKDVVSKLEKENNFIFQEITRWLYVNFKILSFYDFVNNLEFYSRYELYSWIDLIEKISSGACVYNNVYDSSDLQAGIALNSLNAASTTRVGKDIYVGTEFYGQNKNDTLDILKNQFPKYRWHSVDTGGHSDGTFCPVVPGLIVSLRDIPTYKDTFPGWEVVYLPGQSWDKVRPFLDLKNKNQGKWWVPGEELNDDFTNFVESWLDHWVGYVEETVFDVNMLVIDEKNVVVNNYNKQVFDAFDRYGITPHLLNFRHRYFWDGGLHCITSDVHREGTMKDYFPERG